MTDSADFESLVPDATLNAVKTATAIGRRMTGVAIPLPCGVKRVSRFLLSLVIALAVLSPAAAETIPEQDITRLREAFREADAGRASSARRRAYKRVIRRSESLIRRYPDSEDRFKLLHITFQSQRKLLEIDASKERYEELFETARALAQAPMTFSDVRLPADLLLLRAQMANTDMTDENREASISALAKQYEGSKAEARCIMCLMTMARDIKNPVFFRSLKNDLSRRFKKDPEVIRFLREELGEVDRDLRFSGTFQNLKGDAISFPGDLVGYNTFIVFWSRHDTDLKAKFDEIREYQERTKGLFKVFSFNLDELEDAGQSILDWHNLDWEAMILPKGENSAAFLAYGYSRRLYCVLPCNSTGYAKGKTNNRYTDWDMDENIDSIFNEAPYLSLLKTFSIGHFLVGEAEVVASRHEDAIPVGQREALQSLLPKTQVLMRLETDAIIANYKKAATLCDTLIKTHPKARDLWKIRNAKIIALMGIWKFTLDPLFLKEALQEAERTLQTEGIPSEAKVIPQFCLRKDALRKDKGKAGTVIPDFIASSGGEAAPSSAYALGTILAIEGGQETRDLYIKYRNVLIEKYGHDKALWPLRSYLLTPLSGKRLFEATSKPDHWRDRGSKYGAIDNHYIYPGSSNVFTTIEGKTYTVPDEDMHRYHLVLTFCLPETGKDEDTLARFIKELLFSKKDKLVNDRVKPVFLVLSEDRKAIHAFLARHQDSFKVDTVVSLKGGINNPVVTAFGLYMPEESVNTTVVAPNGDIVNNWCKLYRYGAIADSRTKEYAWTDSTNPEIVRSRTKGLIFHYAKLMGQAAFDRREMKLAAQHLSFIYDHGRHAIPYKAKAAEAVRLAEGNYAQCLNDVNRKVREDLAKQKKRGDPNPEPYYKVLEERIRVHETFGRYEKTTEDRRIVLKQLKARLARCREQNDSDGVWAKRYRAWIEKHEAMMQ